MKKMEKKVISITLVMVMLVVMLIPSISSATTGEVTIKDSKLKEAIAEQADINKDGIITEEEMKNVNRYTDSRRCYRFDRIGVCNQLINNKYKIY